MCFSRLQEVFPPALPIQASQREGRLEVFCYGPAIENSFSIAGPEGPYPEGP